jgi:methionyl-tRNA formyltransferase
MTEINYPFAEGDRLVKRNTYFYTPYGGREFLSAWMDDRSGSTADPMEPPPPGPLPDLDEKVFETAILLEHLMAGVRVGIELSGKEAGWLLSLVKRFEITKRLHDSYNEKFRPENPKSYHSLSLYVRFAEVVAVAYGTTQNLIYLNALLKVIDTLMALRGDLEPSNLSRLAWLVGQERKYIEELSERIGVEV